MVMSGGIRKVDNTADRSLAGVMERFASMEPAARDVPMDMNTGGASLLTIADKKLGGQMELFASLAQVARAAKMAMSGGKFIPLAYFADIILEHEY